MPRLRKTPTQQLDMYFRSIYAGQTALLGYSRLQMERWLGIAPATLRRRKDDPSQLTVGELRILADKLQMTPEQVCSFILKG